MPDESGGAPQYHNATETPAGSPDPAMLIAAAGGRYEHHPLFPRADGSTEKRDIQFVSFCRKRTSDQAMLTCPEDIPAHEVTSWAQVVEWWGGEYKAVAKDAKHRTVAWFPSATGEWLSLDGDWKPFLVRSGNGCSLSGPDVVQPAAPEPTPQDAHLDVMTQVLDELRNARVAAAPLPPAADSPLVTMIRAQAAQATAASQAQAAQATATNQATAQRMQTLVSAVAQRPAEPATCPAESTTLALRLLSAMRKLVPTPAAVPCVAEQIPVIQALRDVDEPTAVAPANELRPFVDMFGQVMAADAARTQAERAQTATKPQEAPAPHPPPRPVLVHVPGIDMVEVVVPDADALLFDNMNTEERAAAIRKDPALLREIGIELAPAPIAPVVPMVAVAPVAVAQPSPAASVSPVSCTVVEPVAAIPVVPDLEPTPVLVVAAAGVVVDSACSALRTRHRASRDRRRAARARHGCRRVVGAARATVEDHRCVRRASRNRTGEASGDRASRADVRPRTNAERSARPPTSDRRAEAADPAHPRGARRRVQAAARHRRDGRRSRARHGVASARRGDGDGADARSRIDRCARGHGEERRRRLNDDDLRRSHSGARCNL
jgi:hypothetical protein